MEQLEFDVDGMSCGGCEGNVAEALNGLQGVESVNADHGDGTVSVAYEETKTDASEMTDAIEGAGYEVVS
jgi:copper chaperone